MMVPLSPPFAVSSHPFSVSSNPPFSLGTGRKEETVHVVTIQRAMSSTRFTPLSLLSPPSLLQPYFPSFFLLQLRCFIFQDKNCGRRFFPCYFWRLAKTKAIASSYHIYFTTLFLFPSFAFLTWYTQQHFRLGVVMVPLLLPQSWTGEREKKSRENASAVHSIWGFRS